VCVCVLHNQPFNLTAGLHMICHYKTEIGREIYCQIDVRLCA